ncbi:class I SAM-dependent methyltransferase [Bacillus alkalicellulosilyticus]|uniref:class I SAM-dependent methyltransferase n=1 Tax=Alkalihalobacterium alkalicellulosilyticum TaxID=1912214 RepID=UPI000995F9ED|nr:class I SAM-dependent methyltransferase [Bacillus alkalicellulosilyticus]
MNLIRILPFARNLLESVLGEGDVAVDGTAGNGHDTLFLAQLVGKTGHVYSFDIQAEALKNTKTRLEENGASNQVTLIHKGHEGVKDFIPSSGYDKLKAAIFNLGYLPGGDKSIVTTADTTITAIESLFEMMAPGGIIILVIYHGHEEGKLEKHAVVEYASHLPQDKAHVLQYQFINQKNDPPFIIAIEKKTV